MLRINKYQILLILIIVLLLPFTSAGNLEQTTNIYQKRATIASDAKWTVMFYLAFDNHRNTEKDFTLDTLKDIGSDLNLNLVFLLDGKENKDTGFYCIEEHQIVTLNWPELESDMGDADTLEGFLGLSISSFPAEHYALFVCSTHGSGWQGLGCDLSGKDSFTSVSLLTMKEYKQVLGNIITDFGIKLDLVGFEICVTGSVEAAYEMSPFVNFLCVTEEHGFGPTSIADEGYSLEWNYSSFLLDLKDNPDKSPQEFAVSVVDTYKAGTYTSKFGIIPAPKWYPITKYFTTLSAIDLNQIDSLINAVKNLGVTLVDNLEQCKSEIEEARDQTREYGKLYRKFWFLPSRICWFLKLDPLGYDCFIDLYHFAENMIKSTSNQDIKDACDHTMQEMENVVIANEALPFDPSHGLHIYFPEHKVQYDQSIWRALGKKDHRQIPVSYEDISFSEATQWDGFIKNYLYN